MFRKVLVYGFPLWLLFCEFAIRRIAKAETDGFIGPTLAAVAIGFAMPLTTPKSVMSTLSASTRATLMKHKAVAYSSKDRTFVDVVWCSLFLYLLVWSYCVYASATRQDQQIWVTTRTVWLASLMYIISIVLTEIKEKI